MQKMEVRVQLHASASLPPQQPAVTHWVIEDQFGPSQFGRCGEKSQPPTETEPRPVL